MAQVIGAFVLSLLAYSLFRWIGLDKVILFVILDSASVSLGAVFSLGVFAFFLSKG